MTRLIKIAALAGLLSAGAAARAEVVLDSAGWQAAKAGPAKGARWADVAQAEGLGTGSLLRGRVAVKNRGPKPAQTILLRYSVTARIVRSDAPAGTEGKWAVPFMVDESRVAKIPPNQVIIVPLATSPLLDLYVKRLARHGWRADRLKLQVMVDPREDAVQTQESVLALP